VITVADIEGAAKQQGVTIHGMLCCFTPMAKFGWQGQGKFIRSEPGPGIEAAEYLQQER